MSTDHTFIVTVKLPKNPAHDPQNKVTGPCKYSPMCTDVTGEHHSYLEDSFPDEAAIREHLREQNVHVTRIEAVW
jgi:hypothetical protein